MTVGLILSGGGARAAYQVGVLRAVNEILEKPKINPFRVISGTSAGAINASVLGCESDNFSDAVALLDSVWSGLTSSKVHELGLGAVLSSVGNFMQSFYREGDSSRPLSLLDNQPLQALLLRVIRFERLSERIAAGDIDALSISAMGYTSGDSVSFFQGREVESWRRHRRVGVPTRLGLKHLMASTAIPGIYPSVRIHREYFGDGAVRQSSPLSPALHMGATRLFVVGVSHNPEIPPDHRELTVHPPSIAQMTANLLNGSFIDALEQDTEVLERLNDILAYLSLEERQSVELSNVELLSITPSKAFDSLAADYVEKLPFSLRFLFKGMGATRKGGGASLAAYLLFEAEFIEALIETGHNDALAQRDAIIAFFAD